MDERKFRLFLWITVLIAFILRVGCALPAIRAGGDALLRLDSQTYLQPARALLADGEYWTAPGSGTPMTQRPPGYALILSALSGCCGPSLLLAALLNCVVSALTCYPAGKCGQWFGGRAGGLAAAGLFALNLTSLAQAPLILADTFLGFFCAWAVYLCLPAWKKRSPAAFGLSCVMLALGAWFKPVNAPVLLFGMPVLALAFFGVRRKCVYAWGMALAAFLALLCPLMLRNYRCGAEFDLDSNRGEMLYHSGSAILGAATGQDTGLLRARLASESEAYLKRHAAEYPTVRAQNAWRRRQYLKLIRTYPGAFLRTHLPQGAMLLPDLPTFLENNRLTRTGRGTLDILRQRGLVAALDHYLDGRFYLLLPAAPFLLTAVILYAGALLCLTLWLSHWKRRWQLLILFAVFGFFYLFAGGPVVMPRYQIPALPLLCAMAGGYFALLLHSELRRPHLRTSGKNLRISPNPGQKNT